MEYNIELPTALRAAAQQSGYDGSDALGWRELRENAAEEIDRLRALVAHNDNVRTVVDNQG
jgi:hypothetical protein